MNRSKPSTVVGGGEMNRAFFRRQHREQRRRVREPQFPQRDRPARQHRQRAPPVALGRDGLRRVDHGVHVDHRLRVLEWHLFH
jgi:hypothetical protein